MKGYVVYFTSTRQLSNTHLERPPSPPVMTDELSLRLKELNNVKNELERVKKDKGITSGLVTQMQRDLSSKVSECGCRVPSLLFWIYLTPLNIGLHGVSLYLVVIMTCLCMTKNVTVCRSTP